jgi:hypothetical protein
MAEFYDVEITIHDDPYQAASFYIRPPIRYARGVPIEVSRELLEEDLRKTVLERMDPDEADSLSLSLNHELPDGSATVGRARFKGLHRATGVIVLQQALEKTLNGTKNFISTNSPLNQ